MADKDLTRFGVALKELLIHIGAFNSIPIKPSTADLMWDVEKAILKMIREETGVTKNGPIDPA